jgi:4-hydroxy-4-methyl-2-oxoglutarate aldolase
MSELLARLLGVGLPTLGHFLEDGFLDPGIASVLSNVKIVGIAVTVRIDNADAAVTNEALAQLTPGDVLVVDMGGDRTHASIGAVTACAARAAGAAGIIVDGAVTDIVELREEGLPVFARGTSPLTTKPTRGGGGEVQVPVTCGGVTVLPGDVVVADDNGVLILPADAFGEALARAEAVDLLEPGILARIRSGEPISRALELLPQELFQEPAASS